MAIWYKVKKTAEGLKQFLECNWEFHDFRIESVAYHARGDYTEVYLAYDTGEEGVMLRFVGMVRVNLPLGEYYADAWLCGSGAFVTERDTIIWAPGDDYDFDTEEGRLNAMTEVGWIEAVDLCWAVTDAKGTPVEMPADRIDQVWVTYGVKSYHHFELEPCAEETLSKIEGRDAGREGRTQ